MDLKWTSAEQLRPVEDMWRDIAGLRAENNDLKDDLGDAKKALRQAEETSRNALERAEVAEEKVKSSGQDEVKQLREDRKITDFQRFSMRVRVKGSTLGQLVVKMGTLRKLIFEFEEETTPGGIERKGSEGDAIGIGCCKVTTSARGIWDSLRFPAADRRFCEGSVGAEVGGTCQGKCGEAAPAGRGRRVSWLKLVSWGFNQSKGDTPSKWLLIHINSLISSYYLCIDVLSIYIHIYLYLYLYL